MSIFLEDRDASIRLKDLTIVERRRGPLQRIVLYAHETFGLVLTINEELQHVEAWQALYHEPLVHLPVSFIPNVRDVLILGGGDLFAAREVLKYSSVRSVTLVEHDTNVIDLTNRYYRHSLSVLSDKRFKVRIADARTEFAIRDRRYDLIINDCFDLATEPFTESSYLALESRLTIHGVCSDMIYRHVFEKSTVRKSLSKLSKCSRVVIGLMTIPEYPGALHIQTLWGKNKNLSQRSRITSNKIQKRFIQGKKGIKFDYYNPNYKSFFLYIPPYVERVIST